MTLVDSILVIDCFILCTLNKIFELIENINIYIICSTIYLDKNNNNTYNHTFTYIKYNKLLSILLSINYSFSFSFT